MGKPAHLVIALLVVLVFVLYYIEGYLEKATLLFNVFYFATILISAYALSKLELRPLIVFSLLAVAMGLSVELLNTTDTNWTYYDGGQPPAFVAIGWAFILALIFFISGMIKKYLSWEKYPVVPVVVCFVLFFLFSYTGGYISAITMVLYGFMALMGIYFSYTSNLGWTTGVLISGIIVGTASEVMGASSGLWTYHYSEQLPIHMVLAWAGNAFCCLGLLKFLGFDGEDLYTE